MMTAPAADTAPPQAQILRLTSPFTLPTEAGPQPAAIVLAPGPADTVQDIARQAQRRNIAVLVTDDVALAAAIGADGVHAESQAAFAAAQAALGKDAMIGLLCQTRDEALEAGEAGAAYLAFEDADLLEWAAEVLTVPTVAWGFAAADADFIVETLA